MNIFIKKSIYNLIIQGWLFVLRAKGFCFNKIQFKQLINY